MLCPVQGDCIPPAPSAHMPMLDQPETLVSKMTCYVLSRTMIVNNDSIKLLNLISTCFCSFSVQNMLCILIFPICIVVCYRLAVGSICKICQFLQLMRLTASVMFSDLASCSLIKRFSLCPLPCLGFSLLFHPQKLNLVHFVLKI